MKTKGSKVFYVVRAGAYLILLCNVIISYYHCLQLFMDLVYFPSPLLYHIGVVSLDAVFILSVIVLTESRGRGVPPWVCFIFGLSFTTWSNIRTALNEHNGEGVAVGVSTVIALLLIKIMLTWMERNKHLFGLEDGSKKDNETVSGKKAVGQPTTLTDETVGGNDLPNEMVDGDLPSDNLPHEMVSDGNLPDEMVSDNGTVGQQSEKVVGGNETVMQAEILRQDITVEVNGFNKTVDELVRTSDKVVSLPDRKANGKKTVGGKMVDNKTVGGNGSTKTVDEKAVREEMVDGNGSNKTVSDEKTVDNKLVEDETVVTDEEIKELADIIEVAKQYKKEHGKIGRVKLQKLTGCRQGEARRALKILEQLEKKEAKKEREVV